MYAHVMIESKGGVSFDKIESMRISEILDLLQGISAYNEKLSKMMKKESRNG